MKFVCKEPEVEPVAVVSLEECGPVVGLIVSRGSHSQAVAHLEEDGTLRLIPMNRSSAIALGLRVDAEGCIALHRRPTSTPDKAKIDWRPIGDVIDSDDEYLVGSRSMSGRWVMWQSVPSETSGATHYAASLDLSGPEVG